jgi:hypothetical protein
MDQAISSLKLLLDGAAPSAAVRINNISDGLGHIVVLHNNFPQAYSLCKQLYAWRIVYSVLP